MNADLYSIALMLNDMYLELYKAMFEALEDVGMLSVFMGYYLNLFISELQLIGPNVATCILETFMLDGKSVTHNILIFAFMKLEQKLLDMHADEEEIYPYLKSQMIIDLVERYPMHLILAQNSLPK